MKKLTKFVLGVFTGAMMLGMTTFASEFSVTPANAVFYTNPNTIVLIDASADAQVILPSCENNLPIQVTGITSNGYWQISLGGETYYVAGIGLSETIGNVAVETPETTTTTPVQNAGKYVCVIEEGDVELYKKHTYANWIVSKTPRADYTSHPNYIAMRDEIEAAIARGETSFFTQKYESHNKNDANVGKNLIVDLIKAHPGYLFGHGSDCPTASMYNPYTGEQFAYQYAYFGKEF